MSVKMSVTSCSVELEIFRLIIWYILSVSDTRDIYTRQYVQHIHVTFFLSLSVLQSNIDQAHAISTRIQRIVAMNIAGKWKMESEKKEQQTKWNHKEERRRAKAKKNVYSVFTSIVSSSMNGKYMKCLWHQTLNEQKANGERKKSRIMGNGSDPSDGKR